MAGDLVDVVTKTRDLFGRGLEELELALRMVSLFWTDAFSVRAAMDNVSM